VLDFLADCNRDELTCHVRIAATTLAIQLSPARRSLCLPDWTTETQALAIRRWIGDRPHTYELDAEGVIVDAHFALWPCRPN